MALNERRTLEVFVTPLSVNHRRGIMVHGLHSSSYSFAYGGLIQAYMKDLKTTLTNLK
jgi:hypothetical protein